MTTQNLKFKTQNSKLKPQPMPVAHAQVLTDRPQSIELTLTLLRQTLQTYDRYQEEVLRPYKITPAQFNLLYALQKADRPVLMGTLASQLQMNKCTLTSMVKRLEQKQWVERSPQTDDRRCIALTLTASGVTLMERILSHYRSQEIHALRSFDLAELDLLRVLLCKLEQALQNGMDN